MLWTIRSRSRWKGVRRPQSSSGRGPAGRVGARGQRREPRAPRAAPALGDPLDEPVRRRTRRRPLDDGRPAERSRRWAWCSSISQIARSAWRSVRGEARRRLGERAADHRGHELVGLLVDRERRRLARVAHDPAGRRREADQVLERPARRAGAPAAGPGRRAISSLSRKASAFAWVAWPGSAASSASSLQRRLYTPRCGSVGLEDPPDGVAGTGRRVEAGGVLAQARMGVERLDRRSP